jgi:hypothetical protein
MSQAQCYVSIGNWSKCSHCGTVNRGVPQDHYCGAAWQVPDSKPWPDGIPAEWIAELRAKPATGDMNPPVKVDVRQYDDRGDPAPPANWRVEVKIAGRLFVPAYDDQFMTEAEARSLANRVSVALDLLS